MDIVISLSVSHLNNQEELIQGGNLPTFPINGNPRFLSLLHHDRIYIKTYDGDFPNFITCYFIFNIPIREWVGDFLLTAEEIIWIEPIQWRSIPFNRWEYADLCIECGNRNRNNTPLNHNYCSCN